jgi:hypothetical protein
MKDTMQQVKIESIWSAIDRTFKVTDRKITPTGVWIFYENTTTKQQYSCLEGAFLSRFSIDLTGK